MKTLGSDIAVPLLLELGRALRAWRFYSADPVRLEAALARAGRAWSATLAKGATFEVEVRDGSFWWCGAERLTGPGLEEVSQDLAARGVAYLRAEAGLAPEEMPLLIRALASESGSVAVEELERWLRERGARHLRLVPRRADSPGREFSAEADPRAQFRATLTAELVRALEALEVADCISEYNLAANRVELNVDRLLREAGAADAYRAVLSLGRHAGDAAARSAALHAEARERLRRLLLREALLEYTIAQACESSGLASVHAGQVLLALGDLPVPGLVERYAAGGRGAQQTAMILLALGERALGPLIDQLSRPDPGRARRAARLLGDLQHPQGIPALAAALRAPDAGLCSDAARALVRIGSTAAVHALVEGLGAGETVARAVVSSLSGCRHPLAVRALCDAASGGLGLPEPIAFEAIRALGHPGNGGGVSTLAAILERRPLLARSRERPRRIAAAQALGRIGGPAARRVLETQARRAETEVSDACQRALRDLAAARG